MKVFLTNNLNDAPKTHLIISPKATEVTDTIKIAEFDNLDEFVSDAEATEIVAYNVIETMPAAKIMHALGHWVSKLRHKASLVITGTDAYLIAKAFVEYHISLEVFNKLIHGMDNTRTINLTAYGLANQLQSMGLIIVRKHIEGYFYLIEAMRP